MCSSFAMDAFSSLIVRRQASAASGVSRLGAPLNARDLSERAKEPTLRELRMDGAALCGLSIGRDMCLLRLCSLYRRMYVVRARQRPHPHTRQESTLGPQGL